jgi:hypothetical protein
LAASRDLPPVDGRDLQLRLVAARNDGLRTIVAIRPRSLITTMT